MKFTRAFLVVMILLAMPFISTFVFEMSNADMAFEDDIRVNTDNVDEPQASPDIAIDGNYVYVVWQDQRRGNWDIYLRVSSNKGSSFSTEVRVDDTSLTETMTDDGTNQYDPVIAIDEGGVIYIAWTDEREGRPMIYISHSDDHGATFS